MVANGKINTGLVPVSDMIWDPLPLEVPPLWHLSNTTSKFILSVSHVLVSVSIFCLLQLKFSMDFEKYRLKIAENVQQAPNGECLLWTGGVKQRDTVAYGYINVKLHNKWRVLHAHRVALFCRDSIILESHVDVSHLCHNSLCVAPGHLSAEPHSINNNRQGCKSKGQCGGHGPFPNCLIHLHL